MIRRGLRQGFLTTWELGKVIVPVTGIVTLLKHTPVIEWVVALFSPVLGWVGLSGQAAVPLALAFVLNLYAGIGAIYSLSLTPHEVFVLSVMMSFSHNLLVETAVSKKTGLSAGLVAAIRIAAAFLAAVLIRMGGFLFGRWDSGGGGAAARPGFE
ncbi:MAG: hypothetical protein IRY98_01880, partial [Alicyclobacillaceae bacterium]|nr:hypothetical protein [Alicyclobacillaceae bacterium]